MAILTVSNLTKKFGTFVAVNDISLTLEEGEIVGLLGPNGAGKTTTIQLLLGVLTPTSGSIEYFGKELRNSREEIMEKVNFSSTYTNLPWKLTVEENLSFMSYLYSIKDRTKRLKKIVEVFKLEDLLKKDMNQLSAGQLTRVNLAKSFINYPKVLLLDEPTASLDPDVAEYIHDFLLNQRKEFNVSIIITSHNMNEVEEVCDRVIFLEKGTIIANDTPRNLAKSLEVCHIKLFSLDNISNFKHFCITQNFPCAVDGKHITVDIKEQEIPKFLQLLSENKLVFDEIEIERPTLKDYFLFMAKNQQ